MYSIEQAIRIALLENTSVTDEAIKSVIAAVKGLTEPVEMDDATINELTYGVMGQWPSFEAQSHACKVVNLVLSRNGVAEAPTTPVCAWIIEKVGHPVSMTHYATVAESKRSCGFTVTPHHSRVTV